MEQPTPAPYPLQDQAPYAVPDQTPYSTPIQGPCVMLDTPYSTPPSGQAPDSSTVSVLGPQFCAPYPLDLEITKNVNDRNFYVADMNGNVMFSTKKNFFTLHDRRVLLDGAGNSVVSLTKKIRSKHRRWYVYKGESTHTLFTVKRSSKKKSKILLKVFLANNKKEKVCDFKIKCKKLKQSCVIYLGKSSTVVAKMKRKGKAKSMYKDQKFMVTINPNIDHAFIIALIVINNQINRNDREEHEEEHEVEEEEEEDSNSNSNSDSNSSEDGDEDEDEEDEHEHEYEYKCEHEDEED